MCALQWHSRLMNEQKLLLDSRSTLLEVTCVFCGCRKWRRYVQCCWIHHFRAAMTSSALCPTWPAAPTTSAGKNNRFRSTLLIPDSKWAADDIQGIRYRNSNNLCWHFVLMFALSESSGPRKSSGPQEMSFSKVYSLFTQIDFLNGRTHT